MRTLWMLFISMTLISVASADVQPIGSLGQGYLQQTVFLPDGTILRALATRIEIVDVNTNRVIAQFAERTRWGDVTVSPDSLWLSIVTYQDESEKRVIEIWDVMARKRKSQWEISGYVDLVAFSPQAPLLAVSSRDDIHLWNWEKVEYLGKLEGERRPSQACYYRSGPGWSSSVCRSVAGCISTRSKLARSAPRSV